MHIEQASGLLFASRQMRAHEGTASRALQQITESQVKVDKHHLLQERAMQARLRHLAAAADRRGGASDVSGTLDQMIELARRAAGGSLSDEELAALQGEFDKLMEGLEQTVESASRDGKLCYDKTDTTDPQEILREANKEMQKWVEERVKKQLTLEADGAGRDLAQGGAREKELIREYSARYREEYLSRKEVSAESFQEAYEGMLEDLKGNARNLGDTLRMLKGSGLSISSQADAGQTLERLTQLRDALTPKVAAGEIEDAYLDHVTKMIEEMDAQSAEALESIETMKQAKATMELVRAQMRQLGAQLMAGQMMRDSADTVDFLQQMV